MKIVDKRQAVKDSASLFLENLDHDIYILGTNKYGIHTANWLKNKGYTIPGVINDFIDDAYYDGYKVVRLKDLNKNISIINCIVEGRVIDAEKAITDFNPVSHTSYLSLQAAYPEELFQIDFLQETDSIIDKQDEYLELFDHLADEESKMTLENILNFRLNRDLHYLKDFRFRLSEQYFEPFIKLNASPVFIDGGAFDGETTSFFTGLYPGYDQVYLFEPNERSMEVARKKLKQLSNINFFQTGLWDKTTTLHFDNSLGSASKLTDDGSIAIDVVSIDEVVNAKVDFIKLDIEGAEFNALQGAKRIIRRDKPTLAVCVYHAQDDFLRIPELLKTYNPGYKIYLRHYTQGVFETVMYFV